MISFKSFLAEARMAPLYHATSVWNAERILKENKIKGRSIQRSQTIFGDRDRMMFGVSLTRNFNVGKKYFGDVVFELDQQRLAQRYKIIPFNYWNSDDETLLYKTGTARAQSTNRDDLQDRPNEFEEFLVGDIDNLSKYLKHLWLDRHINNKAFKKYESIIKYY